MTTPQGMLELAERALEQAQDCINRETPEDMTAEEAREDTIAKIREALRGIAALRLSASPAAEEVRHLRTENARLRDEAFLRTSPAGNGGREQELRIQALGAALSRRDWHATERAYEAIRDKFYEPAQPVKDKR